MEILVAGKNLPFEKEEVRNIAKKVIPKYLAKKKGYIHIYGTKEKPRDNRLADVKITRDIGTSNPTKQLPHYRIRFYPKNYNYKDELPFLFERKPEHIKMGYNKYIEFENGRDVFITGLSHELKHVEQLEKYPKKNNRPDINELEQQADEYGEKIREKAR